MAMFECLTCGSPPGFGCYCHISLPKTDPHQTRDRAAVVDPNFYWREIDKNTPVGVKVQLIRKAQGVATYGHYTLANPYGWTHWAPLPKFKKTPK